MKTKFLSFLRSSNIYLFLLPVFFVLHGFAEYYNLITISKAIELTGYYLPGTAIVLLVTKLALKTYTKAGLFSFFIMSVFFFFGSFHDYITGKAPGSLITRYSFLLSALLIILITLFILLKRSMQKFETVKLYLNTLLLLLLIFDFSGLLIKINKKKSITAETEASLPLCNTCLKRDIYFIVADGYSGNNTLAKFFNYNNTGFENELRKKGFFFSDSSFSNYNYTIFSVGTTLDMRYLDIPGYFNTGNDLAVAFDAIRHNRVIEYLKKENYDIHNYSIFDIKDHPPKVRSTLMEFEKNLLATQTFTYRIKRDLGYHLITTFNLKFLEWEAEKATYNELYNNMKNDSLTKQAASKHSEQPKFVYTHLIMPHYPYYYDSSGTMIPAYLLKDSLYADKGAYISYLKYSNKKLLELTDYIQQKTNHEAIIILLSDHGCRECLETDLQKGNAELSNISAVYFPDGNYTGFYKGISNINLFRLVLNNQFNKKLPLVKDSLILLKKE